MKPTILHVENATAVTGSYKALLSYCRADKNFRHVWVLPGGSAIVPEVREEFTVHTLPFVEIGRSPGRLLRYIPAFWQNSRRLARIIRTEAPALLHANDFYNLVPYGARRIAKARIPIAVHARMLARSFPAFIFNFWKAWHLRHADAIIAVSEAVKRDWEDAPKVQVIYDPVLLEEALPPYAFSKSPSEPFRFLCLANYIPGKGQTEALAAVRILRERGLEGFRVDFFGGDGGLEKNREYRRALEAQATEAGLDEYVRFSGPVRDVEALMKEYHAALHFSRSESFGMVCYEALYYGLPVISSDCGGPREMMQPGTSGVLVPLGDIAAYADAMEQMLQNPGQCAGMSAAARKFIHEKFAKATPDVSSAIFASLIATGPLA